MMLLEAGSFFALAYRKVSWPARRTSPQCSCTLCIHCEVMRPNV